MHYMVTFHAEATDAIENPSAVLDHIDRVLDELELLEEQNDQVHEIDVSAHLNERTIEISVLIDAADGLEATALTIGIVRSAIHAADGHTPGWDDLFEARSVQIGSDPGGGATHRPSDVCTPA